jgi:hypothetical protein
MKTAAMGYPDTDGLSKNMRLAYSKSPMALYSVSLGANVPAGILEVVHGTHSRGASFEMSIGLNLPLEMTDLMVFRLMCPAAR